jgi:hypothetical protein
VSARRIVLLLAAGVAVVIVGAGVVVGPRTWTAMQVGAGYAAKQMCSCVFLTGRTLESCRGDLMPGMERIETEQTTSPTGVASQLLFGLVGRRAVYREGVGCALQ